MANQTITIELEWKRRMNLIQNPEFRKSCVKAAKELGITASEWKENKAMLLMFFANKLCAMENKMYQN